jgi:hypothetical protein
MDERMIEVFENFLSNKRAVLNVVYKKESVG